MNIIRNENVCNYFRPNTKEWDVHKVMQEFHEDDVHYILQMRVPMGEANDMMQLKYRYV